MREHRPRPTRQNGGHPVPVAGELRVADGVDSTVDTVEAAPSGPVADRSGAEAKPPQLLEAHDAVLALRKRRDRRIQRKLNTRRTTCGRNVLSLVRHRPLSVPRRP
jgi:hypothetical protein